MVIVNGVKLCCRFHDVHQYLRINLPVDRSTVYTSAFLVDLSLDGEGASLIRHAALKRGAISVRNVHRTNGLKRPWSFYLNGQGRGHPLY